MEAAKLNMKNAIKNSVIERDQNPKSKYVSCRWMSILLLAMIIVIPKKTIRRMIKTINIVLRTFFNFIVGIYW